MRLIAHTEALNSKQFKKVRINDSFPFQKLLLCFLPKQYPKPQGISLKRLAFSPWFGIHCASQVEITVDFLSDQHCLTAVE